ncbi:alpha-L-rhamnosidase [Neptunitalea lumnitzerae]|uniref:alpha-L-rhamnosidase n=1 Tax=Neptunitalea lumnitzerae TaxID=2965509 RepID=A0ABQ5MJP7_9FLAO|nr:alpha-L-rhamnosidase [Neptunitalea sp. Y10]GLB49608.1 hypothetical protein Y10_19760 [Neptunitalea sp. Y10]
MFFNSNVLAAQEVRALKCEILDNPLGIDVLNPRLSWQLFASENNVYQEGYQILVASSEEKLNHNQVDLWDSGKVASDNSIHVKYAGKPLKDKEDAYWKVKVWTNKGETQWSETAHWSMGILTYANWKSTRWIGYDHPFEWDSITTHSKLSSRYVRKEFRVDKSIKQARAYIMGLGLYELYINGAKLGNQVLAPLPTDYTKNVKYNVLDVTEELVKDNNAIGVILGNGRFFTMRQDYKPYKIKTFGYPKLAMQLVITYDDGTTEVIKTDESWKLTGDGPIRSNNEYDGEVYDARKEIRGWSSAGFNDSDWINASWVQEPGGFYEAQMTPGMTVKDSVQPKHIKTTKYGTYILDMGQNMAGWLQLKVRGQEGDSIQLKFSESLKEDGSLYRENLRDAEVTDTYILKGGGVEVWEPRFVYHGFRYVEISGYRYLPTVEDFIGKVVYDDLETTGTFECSNEIMNQVFKNAFWGIRSNYKGMPVDCPQRNERQPWLGDRTTGAYGESFVFNNHTLYAKWLDDIRYAQTEDGGIPDVAPAFWRYYGDNVTWPGTYITVANMLYHQYADTAVIKKHYPYMKKWILYMESNYLKNDLMNKDKYGDWCVPPESLELIHAKDAALKTDGELISSAFYFYLLDIMQDFAQLNGELSDVTYYADLRKRIKIAFHKKFFNESSKTYSNNTVTSNILPLAFEMVPSEDEQQVFTNMANQIEQKYNSHISTGVIGTQFLMRTLSEFGRPDLAFTLASNKTYPSWGYMAENGATTIWELWNGNTANPKMNSQNHVMLLGDLLIWYFENVAGIKSSTIQPGFKVLEMKPNFSIDLNYVKASYQSVYGKVTSNWQKRKGKLYWEITVPVNTSAKVLVPSQQIEKLKINGEKIDALNLFYKVSDEGIEITVPAGTYYIETGKLHL